MPKTAAPRVLFLAKYLDSGGVTTHMLTLAAGLMDHGWQVGLASGGRVGEHAYGPESFESRGAKHFHVHFPGLQARVSNLASFGRAFLEIDRVVRAFRPDVIHGHWRVTSPYARAMQWLHGVPFVTTLHLDQIPSGPLYRLGSFWGDRVIAVSSETRDYLVKRFGVRRGAVRIVFNGADEERFRPPVAAERADARRRLGVEQVRRVVCLVARFHPGKGHDVLVRALSRLRAEHRDVVALCAGEGSESAAVARMASRLGVSDLLRLLGHTDTRDVLWASDALVLPSRIEGFGLAVAEAMLCGVVPIRTPAAGALDQIEDGVNGFLVPFGDHDALSTRIGQICDDDALRATMSAAAIGSAREKFTRTRMVEETLRVYEELDRHAPSFQGRGQVRSPIRGEPQGEVGP
jgi:glycosyltransferase involved in cell wall biosynthesis